MCQGLRQRHHPQHVLRRRPPGGRGFLPGTLGGATSATTRGEELWVHPWVRWHHGRFGVLQAMKLGKGCGTWVGL